MRFSRPPTSFAATASTQNTNNFGCYLLTYLCYMAISKGTLMKSIRI